MVALILTLLIWPIGLPIEETIVHELAHVLTLDPSVFTFGDGGCGGERIEPGCAHRRFGALAEFTAAFRPDRTRGDDADYVNDYAGSAPHEDLAETFTSMVWGWTPIGEVIDAKTAMLAADSWARCPRDRTPCSARLLTGGRISAGRGVR